MSNSVSINMRFLLVVFGLAVAVAAEEIIFSNYHEEIGIAEAARIKLAEQEQDFAGSRIIGGQASSPGDFPYLGGLLITLTDGRTSVCGSSLLTNTRAVTAAHCWWDGRNQGRQITVVLGSIRLYSGGVRVNTTNVQVHESYNYRRITNDIAMIVMDHVDYTDYIQPIAIATGSNDYAGTWATVAGFGKTGDNVPISNNQVQSYVNMQVITNAECAKSFGSYVTDSNLCTTTAGGKATCNGDSGGPLATGSGNNRTLIGIVSFGGRRCSRGFKALSRVTSFAPWIKARL